MFRFTIRDVLWLTVVVAVLALWASERHWRAHDENYVQHRADEATALIQELNERYRTERELRLKAESRLADAERR